MRGGRGIMAGVLGACAFAVLTLAATTRATPAGGASDAATDAEASAPRACVVTLTGAIRASFRCHVRQTFGASDAGVDGAPASVSIVDNDPVPSAQFIGGVSLLRAPAKGKQKPGAFAVSLMVTSPAYDRWAIFPQRKTFTSLTLDEVTSRDGGYEIHGTLEGDAVAMMSDHMPVHVLVSF